MLDKSMLLYRLSLIKYIYDNGLAEYTKPEPLCVSSLLNFHDSVELFLHLVLEHYNIQNKSPTFSEYFDLIQKEMPSKVISQRETMKKLNTARVAFKHYGTIPSKLDLNFFQGITTSFFIDNCSLYFDLEFSKITMLELVADTEIKGLLTEALEKKELGDTQKSIENVVIAFSTMISKYEENKLVRNYRSVFQIGDEMTFVSGFFMKNSMSRDSNMPDEIFDFVDKVKKDLEEIKETIKLIGFGIDFRKYSKYKYIVPGNIRKLNGTVHFFHKTADRKYELSDIDYCVSFCIETYLKLVSFDFSVL
jgi:hypothetical protein